MTFKYKPGHLYIAKNGCVLVYDRQRSVLKHSDDREGANGYWFLEHLPGTSPGPAGEHTKTYDSEGRIFYGWMNYHLVNSHYSGYYIDREVAP